MAEYCRYGSCDNLPQHQGAHRCRCGRLVDEPGCGCGWHESNRPAGLFPTARRAYYSSKDFAQRKWDPIHYGDDAEARRGLARRRRYRALKVMVGVREDFGQRAR